jgi:Domain of unknown function (DUF222)/HNH endonuclease
MEMTAPASPTTPAQLAKLAEAVHELIELDPSLRCDRQSIAALERLRAQLDFALSASVADFDQWGEFGLDGAKTSVAWIDTTSHLPKSEIRAQLRRGKGLSGLPVAAVAWASGDISGAHVDALLRVKSPVTEEALARDEALLVGYARTMKYLPFCNALAYWEQLADQDGTEEAALARKERRDVYLVPSSGGFLGAMNYDLIDGTIVSGELRRLEKELFDADWAEAEERLGRDPHIDELSRTHAQRRADAMKEMAIRSATLRGGQGRRPEPLFSVVIGYDALLGRISQLQGGHAVPPGSLLPYMDQASFERVIFAPGKRAECSVTARFFTGATRRAIELRDLECRHEYCDLAADQCQIDHIIPWSQGGPTVQENGQVLCGFHNRARYKRPPPGG